MNSEVIVWIGKFNFVFPLSISIETLEPLHFYMYSVFLINSRNVSEKLRFIKYIYSVRFICYKLNYFIIDKTNLTLISPTATLHIL